MSHNNPTVAGNFFYHFRASKNSAVIDDDCVCVFGAHPNKSARGAVMVFNTKHEEEVIAETEYRCYGTMACVNGESAVHICHVKKIIRRYLSHIFLSDQPKPRTAACW